MRRRTAIVLASSLVALVLGLQVVEILMRAAVNRWMEQGAVIPLSGRMLLGIAVFWTDFKWLLALPIIISFCLIAFFTRREPRTSPEAGRQR